MIGSKSALCPYKLTTITAFGNFCNDTASSKAKANDDGHIFHVSLLLSINTGVAPK